MSEEDNSETLEEVIEGLQKRLDRHQTYLEILGLLMILLCVHIFLANLGVITVAIEIVLIVILMVRFLLNLERGRI